MPQFLELRIRNIEGYADRFVSTHPCRHSFAQVQRQAIPRQDHSFDAAITAPALIVSLNVDVVHVRNSVVRRRLEAVHHEVVFGRFIAAITEGQAAAKFIRVDKARMKAERHRMLSFAELRVGGLSRPTAHSIPATSRRKGESRAGSVFAVMLHWSIFTMLTAESFVLH